MAFTVSHDAFARTSLVRQNVGPCECSWCGGHRYDKHGNFAGAFVYGTRPDDSGRVNWHKGAFCSKSCHDTYHHQ